MRRVKIEKAKCVHVFGSWFLSNTNVPVKQCEKCGSLRGRKQTQVKKVIIRPIESKFMHISLWEF